MAGKVIAVAQQKGGSGKTTVASNLAIGLARQGLSIAVIDTDPQGSLGRWFMARREMLGEDAGLEFATSSAWGVSYECEKYRKTHDIVIVDTPPKIDADLRPTLREADLVIVPIATSHVDVWATEAVVELAKRERRPVLLVMNRVSARAKLTSDVRAALGQFEVLEAETQIGNRVAYAEALGEGRGAMERGRSKPAASEVEALCSEVRAVLAEA